LNSQRVPHGDRLVWCEPSPVRPRHGPAVPPVAGAMHGCVDVTRLECEQAASRVVADDQAREPDGAGAWPRPVRHATVAQDGGRDGDPEPRGEKPPLATVGPPLRTCLRAGEDPVLGPGDLRHLEVRRNRWARRHPEGLHAAECLSASPRVRNPVHRHLGTTDRTPRPTTLRCNPVARLAVALHRGHEGVRNAPRLARRGHVLIWGLEGTSVGWACPGPRSSGDRAVPSGGMRAGSNPAGGTPANTPAPSEAFSLWTPAHRPLHRSPKRVKARIACTERHGMCEKDAM
jgi:hypothetical protein